MDAVHDVLVREYDGKDLIYVAFICHLDDKTDLKSIGHTGDSPQRDRRMKMNTWQVVRGLLNSTRNWLGLISTERKWLHQRCTLMKLGHTTIR